MLRFSVSVLIIVCSCISCTNPSTHQTTNDSASTPIEIKSNTAVSNTTDQANGSAPTIKKEWLLVPGKSAGLTNINEDAAAIYKRLGQPDGGDAAMQKAVAVWFANHDSTKHSTAIFTARDAGNDPAARVKQIRVTSPSFQTVEGIHTGSTLREIQTIYTIEKGETYTDASTQYRVYDSKQGIAFEIRPDDSCIAIVIHEAGVLNGGTTYLKFRTTNQFINPR